MTFRHNIGDVVEDVGDVKDDIRSEFKKKIGGEMNALMGTIRQNIFDDPRASGELLASTEYDSEDHGDNILFVVTAGGPNAPYAKVVEFGSGDRTEVPWVQSEKVGEPTFYPVDFPFDAPDIQNISGFAFYIEEWMKEKGMVPDYDTYRASALAIAKTIDDRGTYAHPFMRPAWFTHEPFVRRAAKHANKEATE